MSIKKNYGIKLKKESVIMEENRLYPRMFTWLFVGLMITFISGYCLSLNETLL
mgnify:CR=1 FL=1